MAYRERYEYSDDEDSEDDDCHSYSSYQTAHHHIPHVSNSSSRRVGNRNHAPGYTSRPSKPQYGSPDYIAGPSPGFPQYSAHPAYEEDPRPDYTDKLLSAADHIRRTQHFECAPQASNTTNHTPRRSAPKSKRRTDDFSGTTRSFRPDYATQHSGFESTHASNGRKHGRRSNKPNHVSHTAPSRSRYAQSDNYTHSNDYTHSDDYMSPDNHDVYDLPAKTVRQPSYASSSTSSFSSPVQRSRPPPHKSQPFSPHTSKPRTSRRQNMTSMQDDYIPTHDEPSYNYNYNYDHNYSSKLLQDSNWDNQIHPTRPDSQEGYDRQPLNTANEIPSGFQSFKPTNTRRTKSKRMENNTQSLMTMHPRHQEPRTSPHPNHRPNPHYNEATYQPYHDKATYRPSHNRAAPLPSSASYHEDSDCISQTSDRIYTSRSPSAHSDIQPHMQPHPNSHHHNRPRHSTHKTHDDSDSNSDSDSDTYYLDNQSVSHSSDEDVASVGIGDGSDYMSAGEDEDVISADETSERGFGGRRGGVSIGAGVGSGVGVNGYAGRRPGPRRVSEDEDEDVDRGFAGARVRARVKEKRGMEERVHWDGDEDVEERRYVDKGFVGGGFCR